MAGEYAGQMAAGRGDFEQQRKEARADLEQNLLDAWGEYAQGFGLTGGNIARIQRGAAKDKALALGGIDSAEKLWLANTARAEQARRDQSKRNLWQTIGTLGGAGIAAALAIPTGGLSMAALPAMLSAASAGGGAGGALGGLLGGIVTDQVEGELPATFMSALGAAGSIYNQTEIEKLRAQINGPAMPAISPGFGAYEQVTQLNESAYNGRRK
jgi:hypothetical protein